MGEELDPLVNKMESEGRREETRKVSGEGMAMCESAGIQSIPISHGHAVAVFSERVPSWLPVVDS